MVVAVLPCLQLLTHILHLYEFIDAQELVTQAAIERLDQPIVGGLSRSRVVELHTTPPSPFVQRLGGELHTVVAPDGLGPAALNRSLVQSPSDTPAGEPEVGS